MLSQSKPLPAILLALAGVACSLRPSHEPPATEIGPLYESEGLDGLVPLALNLCDRSPLPPGTNLCDFLLAFVLAFPSSSENLSVGHACLLYPNVAAGTIPMSPGAVQQRLAALLPPNALPPPAEDEEWTRDRPASLLLSTALAQSPVIDEAWNRILQNISEENAWEATTASAMRRSMKSLPPILKPGRGKAAGFVPAVLATGPPGVRLGEEIVLRILGANESDFSSANDRFFRYNEEKRRWIEIDQKPEATAPVVLMQKVGFSKDGKVVFQRISEHRRSLRSPTSGGFVDFLVRLDKRESDDAHWTPTFIWNSLLGTSALFHAD